MGVGFGADGVIGITVAMLEPAAGAGVIVVGTIGAIGTIGVTGTTGTTGAIGDWEFGSVDEG